MKRVVLFTVDVEDWFQVENFKNYINFSQWESRDRRFERNTRTLLDIFEKYNIRATFFVLAWNAERAPELVKEIQAKGHEIASHGYKHELCSNMSEEELREDLLKSKTILEDITGIQIQGYRAPGFSINDKTVNLLKEIGYKYDSSYNGLGFNKRHGKLSFDKFTKKYYAFMDPQGFWELPISNLKIGYTTFPWGGGGYFRLINTTIFLAGVSKILKDNGAYVFYMHPWEIDFGQPRVTKANLFFKFRHYVNINRCHKKLIKFFDAFQDCNFLTCVQYLQHLNELKRFDEQKPNAP